MAITSNYSGLTREASQVSLMRGLPVSGVNKWGQPAFVKASGREAMPSELPPCVGSRPHYVSRERDLRKQRMENVRLAILKDFELGKVRV